ncbi:MAG: biotin synthase BioB [Candidatus Glassbacteria bacterium]
MVAESRVKDTLQLIGDCLGRHGSLGREEALLVLADRAAALPELLAVTDRLRRAHSGDRIRLCSIVNARSGACAEDCAFCAQSAHWTANVERYPLLSPEELAAAAESSAAAGAGEFSIVTSGAGIRSDKEYAAIEQALRRISAAGRVQTCASLGRLDLAGLRRLKEAGLECFHHNLEAGSSFFPKICSTHTHQERVEMVRLARQTGLRVCSGGIFGLGESDEQRVELAFELKALDVDSLPLNFLRPIPSTPLADADYLTPETCLRIIAMFRLVLPDKDIVICGGREHNLRELHPLVFWAGANGILTGDYLTTRGRRTADDLALLRDLGF